MNFSAICHRPDSEYVYPSARNRLNLRIVTERSDHIRVKLLYWPRYESDPGRIHAISMESKLQDKYRRYFDAQVITEDIAAYTRYCFEITEGSEQVWFGPRGFSRKPPAFNSNFFEFLWPNPSDGYLAPKWSSSQVFYQIFPERFCNADETRSPEGCMPWGSSPDRECFMGGDIAGILQKLDYLQELGVTCVYTTPIFEAPSNHKYDTVDYFRIDPHFGTEEDLRTLVAELHRRGMRLILDGVFNHCGYYWPYFQDVVQQGEASDYKDWFFIHSYPVSSDKQNYDCVGHYKWMPKINLNHEAAMDYFLKVGTYWIKKFGIDGWRLDVADELPSAFVERFAWEMKKCSPEVLVFGETWGDAKRLVSVDRLDGAMNYVFRDAVEAWIATDSIRAEGFDHEINRMLALYPYETALRMYNLLDSHDTVRFLRRCGDDRERLKQAVALQLTIPGCPAIYYGDEVGMTGDNDPDCRRAMQWDPELQDRELLCWYKDLISLRKSSKSLLRGDYRTVYSSDDSNCFAFLRGYEDEQTLIILNRGRDSQCIPLPGQWAQGAWQQVFPRGDVRGCFAQQSGVDRVAIPGCCVNIFQKSRK